MTHWFGVDFSELIFSDSPPSIEEPYGPYPLYVTNLKNKIVPILHAYAYTKYIGKVDLRFDSDGELVNVSGSPILLNHEIKKGKQKKINKL